MTTPRTASNPRRPRHPHSSPAIPSVRAGERRTPPRRPSQTSAPDAFSRYERTLTAILAGSAVRAARQRAGVSQVQLARLARTTQPSIARLEHGHVSPTIITLDRIARALETQLVIDFEPLRDPRPR